MVWNRLHAHKPPQVVATAAKYGIALELHPPYALELNPVEYLWDEIQSLVSSRSREFASKAIPDDDRTVVVAIGSRE